MDGFELYHFAAEKQTARQNSNKLFNWSEIFLHFNYRYKINFISIIFHQISHVCRFLSRVNVRLFLVQLTLSNNTFIQLFRALALNYVKCMLATHSNVVWLAARKKMGHMNTFSMIKKWKVWLQKGKK